jgi:uncharacterized membrane protein YphA (DoxX/SURF4 family)
MRTISVGHVAFAVVMIGIGVVGLVDRDAIPIYQPPDTAPARAALIDLAIAVSFATGAGLLWPRTAALAARVLLGFLGLWWIASSLHDFVVAPKAFGAWDGCAETAVVVVAAWVLYARLAAGAFATGHTAARIARTVYGLSLIPFGIAHFLYLDRSTELIPGWLPARYALACFTGGAFIAAGAAIATGVLARLAAVLVVVEIALVSLLVWIPQIRAGAMNPFEWLEVTTSVALAAACWVIAESYRGVPWLSLSCNKPPALAH